MPESADRADSRLLSLRVYACIRGMTESLTSVDFEELGRLPVAELRRRWREQSGRKASLQEPPRVRALLVRDLAWMAQKGDLDQETRRLLKSAVRQASAQAVSSPECNTPKKRSRKTKKPQLQAGVTLVREWRGKTYKVKVVEGSNGKQVFVFAGREYRSLTVIAKEITGAHWSGPRFFGLNRVRSIG